MDNLAELDTSQLKSIVQLAIRNTKLLHHRETKPVEKPAKKDLIASGEDTNVLLASTNHDETNKSSDAKSNRPENQSDVEKFKRIPDVQSKHDDNDKQDKSRHKKKRKKTKESSKKSSKSTKNRDKSKDEKKKPLSVQTDTPISKDTDKRSKSSDKTSDKIREKKDKSKVDLAVTPSAPSSRLTSSSEVGSSKPNKAKDVDPQANENGEIASDNTNGQEYNIDEYCELTQQDIENKMRTVKSETGVTSDTGSNETPLVNNQLNHDEYFELSADSIFPASTIKSYDTVIKSETVKNEKVDKNSPADSNTDKNLDLLLTKANEFSTTKSIPRKSEPAKNKEDDSSSDESSYLPPAKDQSEYFECPENDNVKRVTSAENNSPKTDVGVHRNFQPSSIVDDKKAGYIFCKILTEGSNAYLR